MGSGHYETRVCNIGLAWSSGFVRGSGKSIIGTAAVMSLYLKFLFLVILFLHVALAKFTVIIPVRTIALFIFASLLFLVHHQKFLDSIFRASRVYMVMLVIAFIGGFLAFLNGVQLYELAENFLRNTVQPALIFLTTYLAIEIFGLAFVVRALLGFTVVSAVIAILQFAGIDLAWDVRRMLGAIQGDPADIKHILRTGGRPMGLVFTPIMFSYHLVVGYALASMLYQRQMIRPGIYAVISLIALIASAASGTRSLVLGVLVHEARQLLAEGRLKSIALLLAGVGLVVGAYYYLEAAGSRVASLEDTSAVSRMVLLKYGFHLFLDNPFGYGWGFRPADYAWLYWEELSHLPKADAVFRIGIHNAFINFLLHYGVFGFSVIAILAVTNLRKAIALIIAFLAYFINAMFHNAGVFVGDLYFWFCFAVFIYLHEPHGRENFERR